MPKWTVMIFMGVDAAEGNQPLGEEADADIAELASLPKHPDLSIFVERHGDGSMHRVQISKDTAEPSITQGIFDPTTFANGIALTRFIDWAVTTGQHKAGDYSMLVLWGHAYRFAFGHLQTQTGVDALDFAELATVLAAFQEKKRQDWNAPSPPRLDIVAFDACSIATLEMARQLAPYAKYSSARRWQSRYPAGRTTESCIGSPSRSVGRWAPRNLAATPCADTVSTTARSSAWCRCLILIFDTRSSAQGWPIRWPVSSPSHSTMTPRS